VLREIAVIKLIKVDASGESRAPAVFNARDVLHFPTYHYVIIGKK
jgi:hypothetical protein